KALGYTNAAIAVHYSKLVIAIAIIGISIGFVFGWWMGRGLTRMYSEFFTFPFLIFQQNIDLYVISAGVTIASALAGAANAIWSTVSLAPAVAMRPPAPARYRMVFSNHSGKLRFVSQLTTMALRHILRQPLRAFFTSLGVAMSVALLITATFFFDAIDAMIDTVFFQIERQDATVTFAVQQHPRALFEVQRLPGVLRAEPFRATPVLLSNANRSVRTSIMAGKPDAQLSRLLDGDMKPMKPTPEGIFLSERVAAKLGVIPGQVIDIRLYEQDNRMVRVSVVGISQSLVGLSANMSGAALDKLMRNGKRISGAHLSLDSNQLTALYDTIKATPMIAGLALQGISRQKFRDTIGENIGISAVIYVFLSVVITFGVVYNSARIQLSERARELASLRVFGFTRSEVSSVLLLELGIMVFVAQPLGWLLGYGLCRLMVAGFENDLFRIPFIILPATYAVASLVVLAASIISALVVRRRIDRLDLIRVLKTRE
ncbi:MAG: FtsX-like permease family protein, partial [Rhizobiales bacterium]|nr:FtsX-like permease family protein [Hyphomicrobiales bacterium]